MKNHKKTIFTAIFSIVAIAALFMVVNSAYASTVNVSNTNTVSVQSGTCNSGCTYPPVSGSCTVNVSRGEVGDVITWMARGTGGNGYYSYSWSGTDGLSSYYPTISKRYSTSGTKYGTVQITSYGKTISRTCSVVIDREVQEDDDLEVSCSASDSSVDIGESVRYTANVSGGDGDYDYDWSGTNGLSGSSRTVSKSYSTSGSKTATIEVRSGNETETATCHIRVNEDDEEDEDNDDLEAYCKGSPSDVDVGDRVRWTVYPSGGDGDYDYDWDGDENLSGDDKSITKTYRSSGRKDAEVEVRSDGDRVTVRCRIDVDEDRVVSKPPRYNPPTSKGGIYLDSIPATGLDSNTKMILFVLGITLWSAFLSYLFISRRNEKLRHKALLNSIND